MASGSWARNIVLSLFLVPVLLMLIGGAIFLYLFQGEQISNATIDQRVHSTIQKLLGDDYSVTMEKTGLSFSISSVITLKSENITIRRIEDNARIATLREIKVGLDFLTALQGAPQFDKLSIDGGEIEVANLKADNTGRIRMQKGLNILAKAITNLELPFSDRTIREVSFRNIRISSLSLNRREESDILVSQAKLAMAEDGQLNLMADAQSELSKFTINAAWRKTPEGGSLLSLGAGNINSREWFNSVETGDAGGNAFGLDANVRLDARFPFDAGKQPLQPFLKLQMADGRLRIGSQDARQLHSSVINLKFSPDDGHIEMEPSELLFGETKLALSGSINAKDQQQGFEGPLSFAFDSAASPMQGTAETPNVAFVSSGEIEQGTKTIRLSDLTAVAGSEKIVGNLEFGLGEGTPAISGSLSSDTLSVSHLLYLWPPMIAPNVQDWIGKNVKSGNLRDLKAKFAIPRKRLGNLSANNGFEKDEFFISSEIEDVSVALIGALPTLDKASGKLQLDGNQFSVTAERGQLAANKDTVEANSIGFQVDNLFAKGVPATMTATLSGNLATIAVIAGKEPLNITKTIPINPVDISGSAIVDLDLGFDLAKSAKPNKFQWKSNISLVDAASKSEIFGRSIRNANIKLVANDTLVTAEGTANIDGFDAEIVLSEPINGAPSKLRKRNIKMAMDQAALAKQGINLAPVVKGRIGLQVTSEGGSADNYALDLSEADVALPWISWLKGTGIKANATFTLDQKEGVTTLNDFVFSGEGFKAGGQLVFGKSGIVSADLKNIKLVRDDNFNVNVVNKANRLEINASGKSFDARSLINQIVHKDGFSSAKSKIDITLTANLARVVGFNENVMENALINYSTENGQFDAFKVRGALGGELTELASVRKDGTSYFDFNSTNAGATLAMVNIYKKMIGGKLKAHLARSGSGPFVGPVILNRFTVVGEERLASLVSAPVSDNALQSASGKLKEINVREVNFRNLEAVITKSPGYLEVKDGRIRNAQIGLTFDGVIYDQSNQMSVRGTFMPLFVISRIIGGIPIIGDILSNGKSSGLIGITYRLRGAANNPKISVNPVSVIAPGVFKEIFQFQD